MNLRQSITRNITYSLVKVNTQYGDLVTGYIVYGETTPAKEMKKYLKNAVISELPTITVETKTEQRAISLEDFIKYSSIINNDNDEIAESPKANFKENNESEEN